MTLSVFAQAAVDCPIGQFVVAFTGGSGPTDWGGPAPTTPLDGLLVTTGSGPNVLGYTGKWEHDPVHNTIEGWGGSHTNTPSTTGAARWLQLDLNSTSPHGYLIKRLNEDYPTYYTSPSFEAAHYYFTNAFDPVSREWYSAPGGGQTGQRRFLDDIAAWNSGVAYQALDVITNGGLTYRCKLAHTNHVPPNLTYWDPVDNVISIGGYHAGESDLLAPTGLFPDTGPTGNAVVFPEEYQGYKLLLFSGRALVAWNRTTNIWKTISTFSPSQCAYREIYPVYNPRRKECGFFSGLIDTGYTSRAVWLYNSLSGTPHRMRDMPSAIYPFYVNSVVGQACTVCGKYIFISHNYTPPRHFEVWEYDPAADVAYDGVTSTAWTRLTAAEATLGTNWTEIDPTDDSVGATSALFAVVSARVDNYGVMAVLSGSTVRAPSTVLIFKHHESTRRADGTVLSYSGYPMPSVQDEKNTYTRWGWTWSSPQEPANITDPRGTGAFTVNDPNIHGDTEGDDLWTNLMMYFRSGNNLYLNRAQGWAAYFKDSYRQNVGTGSNTYAWDQANQQLDHVYALGLIAYYEYTGTTAYLTAAINIASDIEAMWAGPSGACFTSPACMYYQQRGVARHLLIACRLFDVTQDSRWSTLRDAMVTQLKTLGYWQSTIGIYASPFTTDDIGWNYTAGDRATSSFWLALQAEAMFMAWRQTGDTVLRDRIIQMADFVIAGAMNPTWNYVGEFLGKKSGALFSDPFNGMQGESVYTTQVVNTLVMAYKFTGDTTYLDSAKIFFNRGTKGVLGSIGSGGTRCSTDTAVCHFIDTTFDTSSANFYFGTEGGGSKGELQFCYLIFENGGNPTLISGGITPPPPPTSGKFYPFLLTK